MNHWSYVIAAYAATIAATAALLVWAIMALRRAEAAAGAPKRP